MEQQPGAPLGCALNVPIARFGGDCLVDFSDPSFEVVGARGCLSRHRTTGHKRRREIEELIEQRIQGWVPPDALY